MEGVIIMDPDKVLTNIRALVADIRRVPLSEVCELAIELAAAIHVLDTWMIEGRHVPAEWRHNDGLSD